MTKFPMDFRVCPHCNSEDCVAATAFREEIEAGNNEIRLGFHCLEQEVRLLRDPKKAKLMVPALILYWDLCGGCGTRRLVRAERKNVPVDSVKVEPQASGRRLFN